MGMCCCEGYGFQTVYSGIGYRNQTVLVYNRVSFSRKMISGMNRSPPPTTPPPPPPAAIQNSYHGNRVKKQGERASFLLNKRLQVTYTHVHV